MTIVTIRPYKDTDAPDVVVAAQESLAEVGAWRRRAVDRNDEDRPPGSFHV